MKFKLPLIKIANKNKPGRIKKLATLINVISGAFAPHLLILPKVNAAERPPQYIAISFDGSYNLQMWDETRRQARAAKDFSASQNLDFIPGFTYFISGVYFISKEFRHENYDVPGPVKTDGGRMNPKHGSSAITYDKNGNEAVADVAERVNQMHLAINEGAEIGSHVNGHWDGSLWSFDGWLSEMKQFHHYIEDVFGINSPNVTPGATISLAGALQRKGYLGGSSSSSATDWSQDWSQTLNHQIKGMRAPMLGYNEAMFKVEKSMGYRFDASTTGSMNDWPKLDENGIWRFHLASIPIVGTARHQLSMDYNFYYFDSKGIPDKVNADKYSERYYQSLYNFFLNNYYGSRAPIDVGNHFTPWNAGAYFNGLMKFVKKVCYNPEFPEVQCLNYSKIVRALEQAASTGDLKLWKNRKFEAVPRPAMHLAGATSSVYDFSMAWELGEGGDNVVMSLSSSKPEKALNVAKNRALNWYFKIYKTKASPVNWRSLVDFVEGGSAQQIPPLFDTLALDPQSVTTSVANHIENQSSVDSTSDVSGALNGGGLRIALPKLDLSTLEDGSYYISLVTSKGGLSHAKDSLSEILTSSHLVKISNHKIVDFNPTEWESRSSAGDMIEAHIDEF